jgi:hypothetical protein
MPFLREAGMNDFFPRLLIASLVCFGWWNAFAPGMVFGWIADVLETRTPEWIQKPLYACPPCMASIHGTWLWFYLGGDWGMLLPFVLALSGFNRIVAGNLLK